MSLSYNCLFQTMLQIASYGTANLSLSTMKIGCIFRANGKQITKVIINVASVTSSPVYQVSIQSLSAQKTPSGTDIGGGSPTLKTFTPIAGVQTITLTNPYTPALGDVLAIVVEYSSGTIDASHFASFNYRQGNNIGMTPCPIGYDGISWTATQGQLPGIAPVYSDGTYALCTVGVNSSVTRLDFNNTSTPREYGIHFVPDVNYTVDRLLVFTHNDNPSSGKLTIYNSNNTVMTGSDNVTVTQLDYTGSPTIASVIVPITPITLLRGNDYYMVFSPTSANSISIQKFTFTDANIKLVVFGNANFVSRGTIGSGAWTEDANSVTLMTPILSGLSGGQSGYASS